jgi:hypothetical protein
VAVAAFVGLSYGFYKQPGTDGLPQKKMPWQDPESFKRYSIATLTWAKAEGTKYAAVAKERLDKIEWTKESQDLYEKAKKLVDGGEPPKVPPPATTAEPEPAKPASGASAAASTGASANPTPPARDPSDPVAGPGGPAKPGYYEHYKAGYRAYRDGLSHFVDAKPGSSKNRVAELKAAKEKLSVARDEFTKASELRENDPRLDQLMNEVNQYIFECNKQLKAASF